MEMPVTQRPGGSSPRSVWTTQGARMQSPPSSRRTNIQTAPPNQMTAKQTQRSLEHQKRRPTCTPNTSVMYWPSRVDNFLCPHGCTVSESSHRLPSDYNFHGAHHQLHPETGISLSHRDLLVPFWGPGVCLAFPILSSTTLLMQLQTPEDKAVQVPPVLMFLKGRHSDDPNNVIRDPDTLI